MSNLTQFDTHGLSIDDIFNTANVALNTGRDVYGVIQNGVNQLNDAWTDPMSRRNVGNSYTNQSSTQPYMANYGYGYEEPNSYMYNPYNGSNMYNPNQPNPNQGYYGFWNPRYGKG